MIALRERNFRLYWLGQAVSNTGNWMQVVALGWFILKVTGSPLALGFLGLAQSIPFFTLALAGGMLADWFPRLKLLIVTQSAAMVLAFVLALLALSGRPPLWSLLLVAALAATVTAIDNPTRQAFLSDLVSKAALLNAIALNASIYNGAAVIGPTLAGILLLSIGAAGCFFLNAVSFLTVLLALIMIARAKVHKRNESFSAVGHEPRPGILHYQHHSFLSSFREFGLLRDERAVLAVLGIAAATSLLGRPYLLLLPAFARLVQHVGPSGLGLMVAASGSGSLAGSLLLTSLKSSRRLEQLLVICGMSFGLVLVVFALVHTFVGALLVLVLCGTGATMTMTVANTLLQIYAPSGMRGRVMSLYTLIAAGLTPLGVLLVSGLGTQLGLGGATIVAGIVVGVVVMIGYRKLRVRTSNRSN